MPAEKRPMTPEEYFIFRVSFLADKYGVKVEIDTETRVINFITDDPDKMAKLAAELDIIFQDNLV